jgi:hypothetical protein
MSDQLKLVLYIKNMLSDMIYINSIIATEMIKITENLTALRHGEEFLEKSDCILENRNLNHEIMNIVEKYNTAPSDTERKDILKKRILKH